jgi:N-sulfoglucosamine sulfohydrolase
MQGSAFLGEYKGENPGHIYMFRDRMDGRYDLTRAVVDGKYRYVRYFNPTQPWLQHLQYLWRAPSMRSWENAYLDGSCNEVQARFWNTKPVEELFNIENDPWEVNNLAKKPAYADRLAEMRKVLLEKSLEIRDAGFIPEADRIVRTGAIPAYDYMRTGTVPYVEITQAAFLATEANPENLQRLLALLENEDSAIRYWGAQGLLILGENALPGLEQVKKAAFDVSWNVSIVAAELLYKLGDKEMAIKALKRVLACNQVMARTCALNCIDVIGEGPEQFQQSCEDIFTRYDVVDRQYDVRVAQWLIEKWNLRTI